MLANNLFEDCVPFVVPDLAPITRVVMSQTTHRKAGDKAVSCTIEGINSLGGVVTLLRTADPVVAKQESERLRTACEEAMDNGGTLWVPTLWEV